LDKFIVSMDSDILKFNDHLKELLQQLHARGGTTHNLLSNLFKAYKVVKDKEFTKYIDNKKNVYDEGKDINPLQLMLLVANKFKRMKQDDEWNAPSEEQEQIMVLQAQVNKLNQLKANKGDNPNNRNNDKSTLEDSPAGQQRWNPASPRTGQHGCSLLQRKAKSMRRLSTARSIISARNTRRGYITYLQNTVVRVSTLASTRLGLQMMSRVASNLKRSQRAQRVRSLRLPKPLQASLRRTLNDSFAHGDVCNMGLC